MSTETSLAALREATTESIPIVADRAPAHREKEKPPLIVSMMMPLAGVALGAAISFGITNHDAMAENIAAATDHSNLNNTMSDIASELAGTSLRVDCNDKALGDTYKADGGDYIVEGHVVPFDLLGFRVSPPVMTVREDICYSIVNFAPHAADSIAYDNPKQAYDFATSVSIVLHEAQHNAQVMDEAEAECYAIQKLPGALETLGVDENDALWLSENTALTEATMMPSNYVSDKCRPGGAYDLGISDVYIEPTKKLAPKEASLPLDQ